MDFVDETDELGVVLVLLHLSEELLDGFLRASGHGHHRGVGQQGRRGGLWLGVRLEDHVGVGAAEAERVDGHVATGERSVFTDNLNNYKIIFIKEEAQSTIWKLKWAIF